jgi:hypothetical protein
VLGADASARGRNFELRGREGVDYRNAGGRSEVEERRSHGGIGLFAREGEAGVGAVGFLDVDGDDDAFGGDGEGEALDAMFLTMGDAGEGEGTIGSGRCSEVVDFFFKLGVAEKKPQG